MPSNDTLPDEDPPDIIPVILSGSPFKIKPDNEKLKILEKGRPLPKLTIIKRDLNRNCNRTFQSSWYDIHKWLCGSRNYNKLFCWPCVLMRPESSSWCSTGTDDMKRFSSLASKHAICKSHLKAVSEYDSLLLNFNLSPEFLDDSSFKCKEEDEITDQTDSDEDLFNMYFNNEGKNKVTTTENAESTQLKSKPEAPSNEKTAEPSSPRIKTKITFKNWQELSKTIFPASSSRCLEDLNLYKWKKKIAKQEFRNTMLASEKLKMEIEVLRAKADYYKILKEEVSKGVYLRKTIGLSESKLTEPLEDQ